MEIVLLIIGSNHRNRSRLSGGRPQVCRTEGRNQRDKEGNRIIEAAEGRSRSVAQAHEHRVRESLQPYLQSKAEDFTRLNTEHLGNLLRPLGDNLKDFRQKVEQVYSTEAKERFSLGERIKELVELNNRLSEDANNLTRALKGDSKNARQLGRNDSGTFVASLRTD